MKVDDTIPAEYRIIRHEAPPKAVVKAARRSLINREGHNLVLLATRDGIPDDRFDWWADLRRGRLRIWGGLLRFVDSLIQKGHTERVVQIIPDLLREYIADQFRDGPRPPTAKAA